MPTSLPFYEQVQRDVRRDNSLVVLGRGLGMAQAFANFVASTVRPGKLIIGIHITRVFAVEVLWPAIADALSSTEQKHPALLLPRFLNADYSVKDRKEVYHVGGFVVVTANVLVHDFLHQTIPAHLIDGLVVLAAEKVREGSNDHFAVKLFRMRNQTGFVKAFSEDPQGLVRGFHNCEKVMRMLYLSRLCLWPRFHKAVKSSLRGHVPDLVDLSVNLSDKMLSLMQALREIVRLILDELRISTKLIDISDVYREVEGKGTVPVAFFDEVVRRQIDGAEEKVSWKVKGLIGDLSTLRELISDVLNCSAVQFYHKIVTLRHTSPKGSNWLLRKESQHALLIAKSRVWIVRSLRDFKSKSSSPEPVVEAEDEVERLEKADEIKDKISAFAAERKQGKKVIIPVLEPSPKWQAILSVLNEIREDVKATGPEADVGRVLILTREKRMVNEIQSFLTLGSEEFMWTHFRVLFPSIATQADSDAALLANPDEALLKQVTMTQLVGRTGESNEKTAERRPPVAASFTGAPSKRPRMPGGVRNVKVKMGDGTSEFESASAETFQEIVGDKPAELETLVWWAEWIDVQGRARRLMEQFRPSFVVLYDADVSLVRQTELYKASHPGYPVRLYILAYNDTLEEEKFSGGIAKEKDGFKGLIRERATMALHTNQEGRRKEELFMSQALDGSLRAADFSENGVAGSSADSRREPKGPLTPGKIVVDTRELRSTLPMLLHKANVNIIPLTIEVGDFILSKRIGVERKSVPDLHSSFGSGRLFNQAEALCQHYRYPCLLIELESDKSLSLAATAGGVPSEMQLSHIITKMVLLLQQFPSLRLFWAKGPQDAAELFLAVKQKEDEPDEKLAASLGVDSAKAVETEFNPGPQALLRSLPGVDGHNINAIMRKVQNVAALVHMSNAEMSELLGSPEKGKALYEFVNQEPNDALASTVT